MNRREFQVSMLQLAGTGFLVPKLLATPGPQAMLNVIELYKRAIVIDSLCGPFVDSEGLPGAAALAEVRTSAITAINFTISAPDFAGTVKNLALLEALVEKHPEAFAIIRQHSDIARAKRDVKIGVIPGFQDTAFFEEDVRANRDLPPTGCAHHANHLQ